MAAFAIRHFDALGYVDKSKALGIDESVAKHQARQMDDYLGCRYVHRQWFDTTFF